MKLKTRTEIIRATGLSERTLDYILSGARPASKRSALLLERATGVSRVKWLYPKEFSNPYLREK